MILVMAALRKGHLIFGNPLISITRASGHSWSCLASKARGLSQGLAGAARRLVWEVGKLPHAFFERMARSTCPRLAQLLATDPGLLPEHFQEVVGPKSQTHSHKVRNAIRKVSATLVVKAQNQTEKQQRTPWKQKRRVGDSRSASEVQGISAEVIENMPVWVVSPCLRGSLMPASFVGGFMLPLLLLQPNMHDSDSIYTRPSTQQ